MPFNFPCIRVLKPSYRVFSINNARFPAAIGLAGNQDNVAPYKSQTDYKKAVNRLVFLARSSFSKLAKYASVVRKSVCPNDSLI